MGTENATAAPVARIWWRDFGYYTLRWTVLLGVLSAINYTDVPANAPNGYFWQAKLLQLVLGIGVGVICATLFTLLQNGLNTQRRKVLSWVFAIVTMISVNLLFALGTGRLT